MAKTPTLELEAIDLESALNLVFAGRCPEPETPPDIGEWHRWSKPKLPLPVDNSIADLIKRTNEPRRQIKMRPRAELELDEGADFCPYYAVRCAIANAVSHATDALWNRKQASAQADLLSDLANDAAELASSYGAFISKWKTMRMLRPAAFDGATVDLDKESDQTEDALYSMMNIRTAAPPVLESLNRLKIFAETRRPEFARKGNPTDAWEREFIEQLGYFWYFLTASTPTRGVDFGAFITEAYASIGGNEDANFERSIRTVLSNVAERPEDDRFDRDFRVSRDKIVGMIGGRRGVERRPSQEQLDNELLGYVAAALHDGCFESQARLRAILRIAPAYHELIKDYLPQLRELRGWTEMPQQKQKLRPRGRKRSQTF